jgi:hypothetical protein
MTINNKGADPGRAGCSDSRTLRALMEQISQAQEDIIELGNEIDTLDNVKASKSDIEASVTTENLTATKATIGSATIEGGTLTAPTGHFNELSARWGHFNDGLASDEVHASQIIATDLNVGDAQAKSLNSKNIVSENILIKAGDTEVARIHAVTDSDNNKTGWIMADGFIARGTMITPKAVINGPAIISSADIIQANVLGRLNVKDINITGNITGLNNTDIDAKSITTPKTDSDEIITGGIYVTDTSDDYHLVPTPNLDNNDYYTVVLPSFTGIMALRWVDDNANDVWSATVIGDGKDYEIHWRTVGDTIVVQKLYQKDGRLYIQENANGSLYFGYHATEKLTAPEIFYNNVPEDSQLPEKYKYDCTVLSGQISFGDVYAPGFIVGGTSTFENVIVKQNLTVEGDTSLQDTEMTGLCVKDDDHEYFKADEEGVTVNFESINWNGTDVKVCDDFDTTWVKD